MNSTVFIRIYQVHYSDIPVCQTLRLNLKVCGQFIIESMRQECDIQDPSLLHLHVIVRFNRIKDALDAIDRYHNTRFMNRYSMKVAFYRPSLKQIRDRSQETENQKTYRITSKNRTISNSSTREEKVIGRKRSPSFKRYGFLKTSLQKSPQKQRRRQSSSSSDTSTSSSSSNNGFSCKDIRSRLSTKPSALPRRSEHASRLRSRYNYKEKVKLAIKRRVRVVSSSSSSETSCTPVTSGTESSPTKLDNQRIIESKKVKFSPIKFSHAPATNPKTKIPEARQLIVAKSRKDCKRVVSIAPSETKHQILPPTEFQGNGLSVEVDKQEIKKDSTASLNSSAPEKNIVELGDRDMPRETYSKVSNIESVVENTLIPEKNLNVPNKIKKIQFNIKNTSSFVKDYKKCPNPLDSNNLCSPENSSDIPEDMSKRKRNKSEVSAPSFVSRIPSTSTSQCRTSVQKHKLYKSKSFHSYEVAYITANNPIKHDYNKTKEQATVQPDGSSLEFKPIANFYQKNLIQSPTSDITPMEINQISNNLTLKTNASEDSVALPRCYTSTMVKDETNADTIRQKHLKSVVLQPNGYELGSQQADITLQSSNISIDTIQGQSEQNHETYQNLNIEKESAKRNDPVKTTSPNHEIQCYKTRSPTDSETLQHVTVNLGSASVSLGEGNTDIDPCAAEEASPRTDTVMSFINCNQSSVSKTDETLHLKDDLPKHNKDGHYSELPSNKKNTTSSPSVVQYTKPSLSTELTSDKLKDGLDLNTSEKCSPSLDQSAFEVNPEKTEIIERIFCNQLASVSTLISTSPKHEKLGLTELQSASKESTIPQSCREQNIGSTNNYLIDTSVCAPGPDLTVIAMDAVSKCDRAHTTNTDMPHIQPSETPTSVLPSDISMQQMNDVSNDPTESVNNLKRPMSEDVDHFDEKTNIKPSTNPAKRQKQDDGYVCSLVKPHQMSFLLGEKEKLEKLYNTECRTVCNVVQLLVSQDPSLETHIEKSLSQTLENIGEKYVSKLQETVLELSELET